jgi:predicted small lipoprotein YifL
MTTMKKLVAPALTAIMLLGGLSACEKEGPMERAGEKIDEAAKDLGERTEEAGERARKRTN